MFDRHFLQLPVPGVQNIVTPLYRLSRLGRGLDTTHYDRGPAIFGGEWQRVCFLISRSLFIHHQHHHERERANHRPRTAALKAFECLVSQIEFAS